MSFQGEIASLSLGDLLQNLGANRKSGTLVVATADRRASVQFSAGHVVSYSDDSAFSVAEWFVCKGIVTREHMDEALRRRRRAKRKTLAAILHDLGALDRCEFVRYVEYLVSESVYELLSYQSGSFEFREGALDIDEDNADVRAQDLQIAPAALVMEAARRIDDWELIRRQLPSEQEVYWVEDGKREQLVEATEAPLEKAALELLDGTRTLGDVIHELPYSRFDACSALAELVGKRVVKPLDTDRAVARAENESDPRKTIARLRPLLEREPGNRELLGRLAEVHGQAGDDEESATYYKRLAARLFEDGERREAVACLKRSLDLNPGDLITWQRLWNCVLGASNESTQRAFGTRAVAKFHELGLTEVERDYLLQLTELFPEDVGFHTQLADARYALGEHGAAVRALAQSAQQALVDKDEERAEKLFAHVLTLDGDHQRARATVEELRSGRWHVRRTKRRNFAAGAIAACVALFLFVFAAHDLALARHLLALSREACAASTLEHDRLDVVIEDIKEARDRHSFSFAARRDAEALLDVVEDKRYGTVGPPVPR